jgi:dephospho-CoA kinase
MKIIAFVGMPASGKSEAARIASVMDIPVVNMGDVIRREILRRGLEPNDANTGKVATELRETEGMDAVAVRCISQIKEIGSQLVIIDGIRGIAEVECFRKEFGKGFVLISIYAPIEVRFSRIQKRRRSDDMNTIEGLRQRDERELGWGMGKAIEASNVEIENNFTLDIFEKDVIEVLNNYLANNSLADSIQRLSTTNSENNFSRV